MLTGFQQLLHTGVSPAEVGHHLWLARWRNSALIVGSGVTALAASFIVPPWYRSGATIVIDAGQSPLTTTSGVLGLATQLGIGGMAGQTSPQFYSDLLLSRSLHERLIAAPFPLAENNRLLTLEQFWSHRDRPTPRDHEAALEKLARHFTASANPRTSAISFEADGPSRLVAKLVADTTLVALNDLIIAIRRRRASAEREFLESRWETLGDSLRAHEEVLRGFYERNRSIVSPQLRFEEIRLKRDVDRLEGIYSQIGAQLEQARIQEVRDTPALTVIDAPIEPVRQSFPRRRIWVLTATLLGSAMAVLAAMSEAASTHLYSLRVDPAVTRRAEPE